MTARPASPAHALVDELRTRGIDATLTGNADEVAFICDHRLVYVRCGYTGTWTLDGAPIGRWRDPADVVADAVLGVAA